MVRGLGNQQENGVAQWTCVSINKSPMKKTFPNKNMHLVLSSSLYRPETIRSNNLVGADEEPGIKPLEDSRERRISMGIVLGD